MPVIPQLTITGRDGQVIYEGPGEIQLGIDLSGPADTDVAVSFPCGERSTGYVRVGPEIPHSVAVQYPPVPFVLDPDPADRLRVPIPPEPSGWTLELEIPPGQASYLQQLISDMRTRTEERQAARNSVQELIDQGRMRARDVIRQMGMDGNPWGEPETDSSVTAEEMRRRRAEYWRHAAEAYGLPEEILRASAEYDELIDSTRAEFPHDPYNYGRNNPAGPMHWTPPPEGEDVKPWP